MSSTPASSIQAAIRPPASGPSRSDCGSASAVTTVTAAPRAASDAAASQPTNPEPTTTTRRPWPCSARASSMLRMVRTPGSSAPGTGRRSGSEPVASTQCS